MTAPYGLRTNTSESGFGGDTPGNLTYSASAVSEVSSTVNSEVETKSNHRFVDIIPNIEQPKIESKDHMWKPAPIMGRDFTVREVQEPDVVLNRQPN